ncbi:MAG: SPOR domain-containing protein [Gammaproteobacteria bacterium]|nr:SPOR domain-containing protein [Gammaproteobacteria bacterium]
MNQELKQRLVGAVVLLSLAVIFVPMIFDGGEADDAEVADSFVQGEVKQPPRPQYEFQPLELPLPAQSVAEVAPPAEVTPAAVVAEEAPEIVVPPPPATATAAKAPPAVTVKPAAKTVADTAKTIKSESRLEAKVEAPAATVAPNVRESEDAVAVPAPPKGAGFVVQIVSLANSTNAHKERDRLKQAGFDPFIEEFSSMANQMFRVRVGPVSSREEAVKLQQQLQSRAGVTNSQVLTFP